MAGFLKKLSDKMDVARDPSVGNEQSGSLEMSGPLMKTVHGIEIKKMPIGAYMRFVQKGGKLVPMILNKLFPGESTTSVISSALALNREALAGVLAELLLEVPESSVEALSELFGCSFDDLYNNPQVGPNELMDIFDEWNKLNDLTGFFARANKRFPLLNLKSSPTR